MTKQNQQAGSESFKREVRVSIVLDSVNHMRSAKEFYGPAAEPDWEGFLRDAKVAGAVTAAVAVVNNGARPALWNRFEHFGYTVSRCTDAPDCDELVIAELVRTCHRADVVVIGGGDHKYKDVATVLRQISKRVIVAAVRGSVSRDLLAASDQFVDMPVIFPTELSAEENRICAA